MAESKSVRKMMYFTDIMCDESSGWDYALCSAIIIAYLRSLFVSVGHLFGANVPTVAPPPLRESPSCFKFQAKFKAIAFSPTRPT